MIHVLQPPALGQEITACVVLGACTGAVRAFFPVKGHAAFVPDLLWTGAVLAVLQSYAAGQSSTGVLRWYMAAAAFAGAGAAAFVLGTPLRAVGQWMANAVRRMGFFALRAVRRRHKAQKPAHKRRRNAKRTGKKPKKNLPNRRRMLYNSNVSK